MLTALQVIQEKVEKLSPQKQAEVLSFIEFLLSKERPRAPRKLAFSWADGPDAQPVNLSSVELQHEATSLRIEDETAN